MARTSALFPFPSVAIAQFEALQFTNGIISPIELKCLLYVNCEPVVDPRAASPWSPAPGWAQAVSGSVAPPPGLRTQPLPRLPWIRSTSSSTTTGDLGSGQTLKCGADIYLTLKKSFLLKCNIWALGIKQTFVHLHQSLLAVNMPDAPNLEADGVTSHAAHTGHDEPQSGFEPWSLVQVVAASVVTNNSLFEYSNNRRPNNDIRIRIRSFLKKRIIFEYSNNKLRITNNWVHYFHFQFSLFLIFVLNFTSSIG